MNAPKILNITVIKNGKSRLKFSVKEMAFETTAPLTDEGHAAKALTDQAQVGLMKPNLVSDLIQRGALR